MEKSEGDGALASHPDEHEMKELNPGERSNCRTKAEWDWSIPGLRFSYCKEEVEIDLQFSAVLWRMLKNALDEWLHAHYQPNRKSPRRRPSTGVLVLRKRFWGTSEGR